MNKVQQMLKAIGKGINQNSPSILIGAGISGFFSSLVMAVRATPPAIDILEAEAYREMDEYGTWHSFPVKKQVELVWPLYLPAASTALLSTTAILMGNRIHLKRTAALASLYSLAEGTLKTYQDNVLKTVGEKKAREVQGNVVQETMDNADLTIVHNEGGGHELCFEMYTGRYFYSTADKIRSAINKFNEELLRDDFKTLNELFYDLGLPSVDIGDQVGWELEDGLVDIFIGSRVAADDRPCLVVEQINRPKPFKIKL